VASFDLFLPMLLRFEGGYVDDPTDPGGETNKGVTMTTFQHCSHELLGIEPTSDNLKSLSDAQAGIIYRSLYWDNISGDDFELQDLANIVCDFYVNAGTHATSLLQRLLNALGAHLVEDGSIGPASIQALGNVDEVTVYRQYKQGRIDYYKSLGQRFPQFLQGWLNRANSFPNL
jgi:lysozyme family protein